MKPFLFILIYTIIFFLLFELVSGIEITEIFYDAPGNDNNMEFIEIYLGNTSKEYESEPINLSGYVIGDLESNDTLALLYFDPSLNRSLSAYALLVEEEFNYTGLNCAVYSAGKTIGNNLDNTGDSLKLYDIEGRLTAWTQYTNNFGAGNGKSIEVYNNSWMESLVDGGTPCLKNSLEHQNEPENNTKSIDENKSVEKLFGVEILLDDTLYTNVEYSPLFKVRNLNYSKGEEEINVTLEYTIIFNDTIFQESILITNLKSYKTSGLGAFFFNISGEYLVCGKIIENDDQGICKNITVIDSSSVTCDININSFTSNVSYHPGDKIFLFNTINNESFPFIIEYWIEDAYGDIVKKKSTTENTDKKTWTIPDEEGVHVYFLKSELHTSCNNSNNNTNSSFLFFSKNDLKEDSDIFIDRLYLKDNNALSGNNIKAKIELYRGNTTRNSVQFYIRDIKGKKISDITLLSFFDKFKKTTFSVSVKLDEDCSLTEGEYYFVAEGLGVSRTEKINIVHSKKCNDQKNNSSVIDKKEFSIKSFYTRTKNFKDSVNLYSTIEGAGKATVLFYGPKNKDQREIDFSQGNKVTFTGELVDGVNLFLLKVMKESEVIDMKELELYKEPSTKTKEIQENVLINRYIQNKGYLESLKKGEDITTEINLGMEKNNTVFQSKSEKQKGYLKYMILGFFVMFVGVLLFKNK